MRFFHKRTASRELSSAAAANPAEQLQADIKALEMELAESERRLADLDTKMRSPDARVLKAIRAGDNDRARVALLEQQEEQRDAPVLAADIKVLRAILDECYDFVRTHTDGSAPGT